MARSLAEQKALAFGPKFSASLSILGSAAIVWEVLRDKKKQGMVYHRILLGMSIFDLLISSAWFMSTWPVPSDTQNIWGAVGNQASCNAQGFFIQLKIANPMYNSALALYYVLVVRYGWKEERLKRVVEPFFHTIPVVLAVSTSTAALALGLFNNANLWCWLAAFPSNCYQGNNDHDISEMDDLPQCERGKHAWIYRLAFFYTWYWASFVWVTIAMFLVYWTVRQAEQATQKYAASTRTASGTPSSSRSSKNTRRVATQAVLYIVAYGLTALFATLTRVLQAFADKVPFIFVLGMTIFYPMQGLFNYLIYIRPRYLRNREKGLKGIQAATSPHKAKKRRRNHRSKQSKKNTSSNPTVSDDNVNDDAAAAAGNSNGDEKHPGAFSGHNRVINISLESGATAISGGHSMDLSSPNVGSSANRPSQVTDDEGDYFGDDYKLGCMLARDSDMFDSTISSQLFRDSALFQSPTARFSRYSTTSATGEVVTIASPHRAGLSIPSMSPTPKSHFQQQKTSTLMTDDHDESEGNGEKSLHTASSSLSPRLPQEAPAEQAQPQSQPRSQQQLSPSSMMSNGNRVREAIRQVLAGEECSPEVPTSPFPARTSLRNLDVQRIAKLYDSSDESSSDDNSAVRDDVGRGDDGV